ncbi:ABC-2 type transport system ATP-binding protein [Geodermatophilus saharensis]|uniref:ABC-2 type transport system ATP-binding protein n=1 Tax=Geodermatophilus saharensis TaxID=1137994 RepID=A0A239BH01_9ACTN|nr:ABC transporter ATP-binding protein [Geodermatophilus saharensis]SNS06303.1 ABC-2 type transport system ATP-binding protein [Geodermatophilus saharensis]
MTTPALDVSGLTVRHGDVLAVDGLDLRIGRGETVALLGPNGAGKSSTVSAALGLVRPAAGGVRVLGRAPADAVRAGCVGAMLQHGGLPTEARVGEVLHLVRRSYPDPWPPDDLVATTGIDGLLGRPVEALSGGQRQRVLLALALAGQPPLLLLDEPTSAMDVEGRRAFWVTMRALAARGTTVVFATHHLEEADAVADRVVVLAGGRLVADGSSAAVRSAVSGRSVRLTAERLPDDLPGVTAVTRQGAVATLATADVEATLRALLDHRVPLTDLEVRGASLEDAVLTLTTGAAR